MKKKKFFSLLLILSMGFFTFKINAYAATLPMLGITTNEYANGDRMLDDEITEIEVEQTLQLYAIIWRGNDVFLDDPNEMGRFVDETNLSGVNWTSSNPDIATVDNTGKVTGVTKGETTITAEYEDKSYNYEITVKNKYTGIGFAHVIPEGAKVLNKEFGFLLYLHNIPNTEKENIQVTIDDENVAKIIGIDLCDTVDGPESGIIIANVKLLSLGHTTITATLNYNGETYSDSYDFTVVESAYTLLLSAKEYTNLPSSLEINNTLQLIATFKINGGSVIPEDVTSDGTIWESSNENIVKVDSNGLVTAVGEGNATITAKYRVGDEIITSTYNLNITNSAKAPVSTENPNTGESLPLVLLFTGTILAISLIFMSKTKKKMYKI